MVSRTLFKGLGLASNSEAFLLGLLSVSDWADLEFQDSRLSQHCQDLLKRDVLFQLEANLNLNKLVIFLLLFLFDRFTLGLVLLSNPKCLGLDDLKTDQLILSKLSCLDNVSVSVVPS